MKRFSTILVTLILSTFAMVGPVQSSTAQTQVYATGNVFSSGFGHTCIVSEAGSVSCWGLNDLSQSSAPLNLGLVTQIDAGSLHTCAINAESYVRCWGHTDSGRIDVPADLGKATQVSAGGLHTCAIDTSRQVRCWGWNSYGQISVPQELNEVTNISSGGIHTCAVGSGGKVKCWGYNGNGQTDVPNVIGIASQVSAGGDHSCAVNVSGQVFCWGRNDHGQASVPNNLGFISEISSGYNHTCAITQDREVKCWGDFWDEPIFVPADLGKVSQITSGYKNTCALTFAGTLRCWGVNDAGQNGVPLNIGKLLLKKMSNAPLPTVTEKATTGGYLVAETPNFDAGSVIGYQWLLDGVSLVGEYSNTYKLKASDFLKKLSVSVTVSKTGYVPETKNSVPVIPVKPKEKISSLRFTGSFKVGAKAFVSSINRNSKFAYSYQWLRNGEEIAGASSRTYQLVAEDAGSTLSAKVCALYLKDVIHCVSQDIGSPVELGVLKNVRASFSGLGRVGRLLSAAPATFESQAYVSYQWLRNGESIVDATRNSYFVDLSDKGSSISLRVIVSKPGYETVVKTSTSKFIN